MQKRLYDPKSSHLVFRPVEWLGWKIEQLIWIMFHPLAWMKQRSAWHNARLYLNFLNTFKYVLMAWFGKEAFLGGGQIHWDFAALICIAYFLLTWLNDRPEWDIEVTKKKQVDAQIKLELEKEKNHV